MKIDIKKLIAEAAESVKQDIATGKLKLNENVQEDAEDTSEARASKVNKNYTHFLVGKDNKIVNAWDYKGQDAGSIKQYLKDDMKDMDIKPSDGYKLYTVQTLKSKGIDPFSWDNWTNQMQEDTIIKTPDGTLKTATQQQKDQAKNTKDTVKVVQTGKPVLEKKGDDTEAPDSVEGEEAAPDPAEQSASPSDDLQAHIAAAIDSAAKCLGANEDRKYEAIIGKITAQLTKAQDYLGDLKGKESELAEQAEANKTVELDKYFKNFIKALRKYTKDEALIAKITKIYKPIAAKFMGKGKTPEDTVSEIWKHFTISEAKK